MKKYLLLFCPCLLLFSCSENKTSKKEVTSVDSVSAAKPENTSFIPVTSILQNEITNLDSLPVTILEITSANNKQDSAWLPVAKVKPKLQVFLSPVIDEKNMASLYKETKFNDQSTEAITFMYDPKTILPDSVSLRRWDVYFDPNRNIVRRVYIVKQAKENNLSVTQQLTWKTGKSAKIVTLSNDKNVANPIISEKQWIWDLSE